MSNFKMLSCKTLNADTGWHIIYPLPSGSWTVCTNRAQTGGSLLWVPHRPDHGAPSGVARWRHRRGRRRRLWHLPARDRQPAAVQLEVFEAAAADGRAGDRLHGDEGDEARVVSIRLQDALGDLREAKRPMKWGGRTRPPRATQQPANPATNNLTSENNSLLVPNTRVSATDGNNAYERATTTVLPPTQRTHRGRHLSAETTFSGATQQRRPNSLPKQQPDKHPTNHKEGCRVRMKCCECWSSFNWLSSRYVWFISSWIHPAATIYVFRIISFSYFPASKLETRYLQNTGGVQNEGCHTFP